MPKRKQIKKYTENIQIKNKSGNQLIYKFNRNKKITKIIQTNNTQTINKLIGMHFDDSLNAKVVEFFT